MGVSEGVCFSILIYIYIHKCVNFLSPWLILKSRKFTLLIINFHVSYAKNKYLMIGLLKHVVR